MQDAPNGRIMALSPALNGRMKVPINAQHGETKVTIAATDGLMSGTMNVHHGEKIAIGILSGTVLLNGFVKPITG